MADRRGDYLQKHTCAHVAEEMCSYEHSYLIEVEVSSSLTGVGNISWHVQALL